MATHNERFLDALTRSLAQAQELEGTGFDDSQLKDIIINVAVRTEILLKAVALPHLSPRTELCQCINALKAAGVSKKHRDILHALRKVYNDSKHKPRYRPSLLDFKELLPQVANVFRHMAAHNLPTLTNAEKPQHNHVLWLAVWDHYIGGDSEVHIIIPSTGEPPPTLDLVYIDMAAWGTVKDLLRASGSVRLGKDVIPAQLYRQFVAEGEFHEAIVFEGEYRTVITTLAAHERREDLLPGLRRQDDTRSMVQAFVLAAIDVATGEEPSSGGWANAISARAVETYAVPSDYHLLSRHSKDFGLMVERLPDQQRRVLNGPLWVSAEKYQAAIPHALAKHSSLDVLVNQSSTVLVRSS